jgi:PAS domain-containing protein
MGDPNVPDLIDEIERHASLRQRALRQVDAAETRGPHSMSGSAALGVLHKLASSPDTATEALSLLHELQVYQVELAVQHEELRASLGELETRLHRQQQLYDHSPAGAFTIDQATVIAELNLAGARLLKLRRDAALGRRFDAFLTDRDGRVLQSVLALAAAGRESAECEVRLNAGLGPPTTIRVSAGIDPAGSGFVLATLGAATTRGI